MPARRVSMTTTSVKRFAGLAAHDKLRLNRQRIGRLYAIENARYEIFRDTEQLDTTGEPVILVIGFRLKLIRSNPMLHWLFQRACIITTPFWSGLSGFKTKLWLVEPDTKNYLGVYDWRGRNAAQDYLDFLLPVLGFFSVKGSVWAKQVLDSNLQDYLEERKLDSVEKLALITSV